MYKRKFRIQRKESITNVSRPRGRQLLIYKVNDYQPLNTIACLVQTCVCGGVFWGKTIQSMIGVQKQAWSCETVLYPLPAVVM